jgi:aldehyde dehydrogenase (NAD+)
VAITTPSLTVLPQPALLVGGQRITDASGGEHEHVYAATGRPTIRVPLGDAREMDAAVQAARRALPTWRHLRSDHRRDLLLTLAQRILAEADALSALQTVESGVPRRFACALPEAAADYFAYNAGWADKIGGTVVPTWPRSALDYTNDESYGVVAVILPWNAALVSFGQLLGPALAGGNTVVVKPSELAPFTGLRLGELALECGFPPGVVNVVPAGAAGGTALARHRGVDKLHFTGSSATARKILAAALDNLTPVSLELGGKSALLVFADADPVAAAEQAISAAIVLSGQGCTNATRVLVESTIYDQVLRLARGLLRRVAVGDPFDAVTSVGPVVTAAACERILGVIRRAVDAGEGRLVAGGERIRGELADGYFIAPTLFADVDARSDLAQEEIFGPIVSFMRFETEEEAVRLANESRYGLAAYVHTNDLRRALRVSEALEAGNVWVNGLDSTAPSVPFGGIKQSGQGRVGGRAGIREFTRPKNVWIAR